MRIDACGGGDWRRIVGRNLAGDGDRILAWECPLAGDRLVDGGGHRELVALRRELTSGEGFRCAVSWRPEQSTAEGQRGIRHPSDPEVRDLRAGCDEDDVLGLDVSVEHARLMGRHQRITQLGCEAGCRRGPERTSLQPLLECASREVLEDQVEPKVWVLAHIVESYDIGVAHPGRGSRLLSHPIEQRLPLVVGDGQVVAQQLHGDVAIEHRVVRQEHTAHGALAVEADDPISPDLCGQRALA